MRRERIHTDKGAAAAEYSAVTRGLLVLQHKTKVCATCRRTRSMGQYAAGDDLCAQCRRRA